MCGSAHRIKNISSFKFLRLSNYLENLLLPIWPIDGSLCIYIFTVHMKYWKFPKICELFCVVWDNKRLDTLNYKGIFTLQNLRTENFHHSLHRFATLRIFVDFQFGIELLFFQVVRLSNVTFMSKWYRKIVLYRVRRPTVCFQCNLESAEDSFSLEMRRIHSSLSSKLHFASFLIGLSSACATGRKFNRYRTIHMCNNKLEIGQHVYLQWTFFTRSSSIVLSVFYVFQLPDHSWGASFQRGVSPISSCFLYNRVSQKKLTVFFILYLLQFTTDLYLCWAQNRGEGQVLSYCRKCSICPPFSEITVSRRLLIFSHTFWMFSWLILRIAVVILLFNCVIFCTGVLNILSFTHPHKKKSKGVRSGDRGGQAIRPPLPIHLCGRLASKNDRTSVL